MEVNINNRSRSKIAERAISDLVLFFATLYKLPYHEISIAFVGDRTMRRINFAQRGKNKITDILSFAGEDDSMGELIIDYCQLKRQASFYSKNITHELLFIIVHGLLHLLGYTDDTEAERLAMIEKGNKILNTYLNKKSN